MIFAIIFAILWLPVRIFMPTKIIHKDRLKKGKAIVTSNHYSNFDVIILDIFFNKKFRFMAKIELFKNKFFGWLLKRFGAFPVDREKLTPSVFKQTLGLLSKDKQVFIFPEGTRNKSGDEHMNQAKAGVITFASKGDAEIVPMVIYAKPKIFKKNYIIVGESFKVVGENPKRLTKEEVETNLALYTEKMEQLRVEVDEYVNKKRKKRKK